MPQTKLYPDKRTKWRENKRHQRHPSQRLAALAPDALCRTFGSCTLYCSAWEPLYLFLLRQAVVVTDLFYKVRYDYTKARRRPSPWDRNFAGHDQDFDPTSW